jgi:hypothetical protein
MSERDESYMRGWKAGYHNATLAERNRILQIIKFALKEDVAKKLEEQIKKEDNDLSRQG